MTFFLDVSRYTSCFGAIRAAWSVSSDMPALAMTKLVLAALIPASTFSLRAMFSRTTVSYTHLDVYKRQITF